MSGIPSPRRSLIRRCVDFWTLPLPAANVALFRILLGVVLLTSALSSLWPNLERYAGADGLCVPEALDGWLSRSGRFTILRGPINIPFLGTRPEHGPLRQVLPGKPLLSDEIAAKWTQWASDPAHVQFLFWVWIAVLLALTVGFCTRPATILAWLLTVSFQQRLRWLNNGGDSVLCLGLFYLMFTPSGLVWSLDSWLRKPTPLPGSATLPAWPVRLMQIQLCMIYLFTGLIKLTSGWAKDKGWTEGIAEHDWLNGSAVYWVLNDVSLNRWPYSQMPIPLAVCRIFSWATLLFEIGFSLFVLFRRLRPWLLLAGIAFHAGIWLHTEVGYFSPATLCFYVLFLSGEDVRNFFGRWRRRRGQTLQLPQPATAAAVAQSALTR